MSDDYKITDEEMDLRPARSIVDTPLPPALDENGDRPVTNTDRMLSLVEVESMIEDMALDTRNRLAALEIARSKYGKGSFWKVSDIVDDARVIERYLNEG